MILDNIANKTRERVSLMKKGNHAEQIMAEVRSLPVNAEFSFEEAIGKPDLAFICEVKKASPSKGIIADDYPYLSIARDYEKAGAAAISVLTEPFYFQGDNRHLAEIASSVHIPVLRKDFTVDALQIYEAKCLGASAVLLIVALMDVRTLSEYLEIAYSIGLSALVESHTAKEVRTALQAGARIIGVNNRDLKTFRVDLQTSLRLRDLVPPDVLYVSESGIRSAQDIEMLRQAGVNAILIGETLMRSPDKSKRLAALRGKIP
ncbi:MAG: indole-3-glycerol phosphate synthase TrpC [Bacillota bacterium]|nr:indole-3-glycerol phosphate synthase TrpC [Bacillota bacterium]